MCPGAERLRRVAWVVAWLLLTSSPIAAARAPTSGRRPRSAAEEERRRLLKELGLHKKDQSAPPPPTSAPPSEEVAPTAETPEAPGPAPQEKAKGAAVMAPPSPSFRRAIHPLLMRTCTPCHALGGPGAATPMRLSGDASTDHATLLRFVDLRDPTASPLLMKPSGAIHGGGTPWPPGSAPYQRVLAWIKDGARLDGAPTPAASPSAAVSPTTPAREPRRSPAATAPPTSAVTPSPEAPPVQAAGRASVQPAPGTAVPEAPPSAPIDFGTTIHPILMSACAGCHGPKGPAAMSRMVLTGDATTDEPIAERQLDLGTPSASPLLTKSVGQMHAGGAVIPPGDPRHGLLLGWAEEVARRAAPASATKANAPAPVSPRTTPENEHVTVAPVGAAPASIVPALPYGLALDGRFDVTYERRQFSGDPFSSEGVNALRSYHHFLFLSRESTDDPFGLQVEMLTLLFWEVHARLGGLEHGSAWKLVLSGGKIMVPFGADPLMHQSYGGLAGFDQRILPVIWTQEGLAAHLTLQRRGAVVTDDLYVVRGYALQDAAGVLNLQNDFSPDDDTKLGFGNRLGAAWMNVSGWYSTYYNPLGFGRRLFMQALDLMIWRPRRIPVLGHFSAAAGFLRADVSGGGAGVGGPGKDYYHFGSYFQLRYHPTDWLYLQYRQGLFTFNNRRGLVVDDTRLTAADGSTHNFGVVARYRGLTAGVYYFINLEKVDEVPNDLFRVSLIYDF